MTLDLVENVLGPHDSSAVACMTDGGSWTYGELRSLTDSVRASLMRAGIGRGDRVLLLLENRVELIACMLAIFGVGACVTSGRPTWTRREVEEVVVLARPKLAIVDEDLVETWSGRFPVDDVCVVPKNEGRSELRWPQTASAPSKPSPPAPEDDAIIFFTSGGIGRPKAVLHAYASVLARIENARAVRRLVGQRTAVASVGSLCYVVGFAILITTLARGGIFVVLARDLSAGEIVERLARYEVGIFGASPSVYEAIARVSGALPERMICTVGGDRCPDSVHTAMRERHGKELYAGYGMTECMNIMADGPPGRRGSVGRCHPWTKARLMGNRGEIERPHEVGRLWVASPMLASAYLTADGREPLAKDGWFDTGDLMYFDEDGWFWFVARERSLFKRDGVLVSPTEIEDVVRTLPEIAEAHVVDVDVGRVDKAIACFAVPKADVDEASLIVRIAAHLSASLAPYKRPDHYELLPKLPRKDTGKIDEKALRSLVEPRLKQDRV